ncbi:putative metal-dependent HD superfamily phosphohydrolase [Actinomadura pelletieri DSM 43383]|uniref:Putative metal-dependent HD superfamily phosphohydrolase n=1 Tax=Actinomadura pelletieri DSM 43383 TaxID=1120940 RepID=A0A495QII2_9ACTN|nr:HD domain-containing protein [Actinomadura pelletieri]RKS71804.1 putative metal-dependent HD superfamily phosphohydrolase [Actinomadura pelletieri DSM 43383]
MDLVDRWVALAGPHTRHIGTELDKRYGEPHRRHHTRDHLTEVLDVVDELAGYAAAPDVVRLAAWFHDAVYDPERADNEERSARLAARMLADTDLPAADVEQVVRLVELTATHAPADDDRDGQVLCDADLAILGAEPDRYAAYAAAVREEYAFVPDELFRAGRSEVLNGLLALPKLFHTATAHERYERRARNNIRTELTLLSA